MNVLYIIQSKERLIVSLREGSGSVGEAGGVSTLEFDTVKQERDMLKEEIQQSRMTIDNLRVELAVSHINIVQVKLAQGYIHKSQSQILTYHLSVTKNESDSAIR